MATEPTASMTITRSSAKRPRPEEAQLAADNVFHAEGSNQRVSPRQTISKHEKVDEMNPSLMTERQQIAFLLRQSAQEKTSSSSSESDEEIKVSKRLTSTANKENINVGSRRKRMTKKKNESKENFTRNENNATNAQCCLCNAWKDSMFLCILCDKKYPTQKALGLVV